MNTSLRIILSAALLAGTAAVAAAAIERNVEKSFPVNGSGTLRVETYGGRIEVQPSNNGAVKVTAKQRIRADSESEADEMLKKLELTLEQNGNDVRVAAKYAKKPSGFGWGSWPPVQVDVVVSVPASYAVDLKTSGGKIAVGDLNGEVHVGTSGGAIELGRMGGMVDAHTSGGDIALKAAGGTVKLHTSGGNLTVGRVTGAASLSTSGGNILIESATSALKAHTRGGNFRATIVGPLTEDCSVETSGGNVRVNVDKTAAFRLEASTSGGSVDLDGVPVTVENLSRSRSRLAGDVNGGGKLLRVKSSGGGVSVRAN